ncbi:hypothetical protein GQ54DRAFT_51662 [Martensiomyces pterosporus]|nr:hypothetical protein GQ54DRAFT_51662 [Martensiomyces pterosporus]
MFKAVPDFVLLHQPFIFRTMATCLSCQVLAQFIFTYLWYSFCHHQQSIIGSVACLWGEGGQWRHLEVLACLLSIVAKEQQLSFMAHAWFIFRNSLPVPARITRNLVLFTKN